AAVAGTPGPPSRWNIGTAPATGFVGLTTTTLSAIVRRPGAAGSSGTSTVPHVTRPAGIRAPHALDTSVGDAAPSPVEPSSSDTTRLITGSSWIRAIETA